jgi:deoxyribodipyrimidine photolyase
LPDRPIIFWFRDGLRLAEASGLSAAHAAGKPRDLLYIFDEQSPGASLSPSAATCAASAPDVCGIAKSSSQEHPA